VIATKNESQSAIKLGEAKIYQKIRNDIIFKIVDKNFVGIPKMLKIQINRFLITSSSIKERMSK